MTVVFCGVVLMDVWADRGLSSHLRSSVVGPVSVIVWVLTLFGAFGVGPAGWLRSTLRW